MNTPVSFPVAKLLKEKGFDEKTLSFYSSFSNKLDNYTQLIKVNSLTTNYSAPTIAEVVMWLYEKHWIWINLCPHLGKSDLGKPIRQFDPDVWTFNNEWVFNSTGLSYYNHPTEAYEAAILHCLKELV